MSALSSDVHFSGLVAARNNETTIRWQKMQIFFLINSALLGMVVSTGFAIPLKLIGCSLGLAVAVIWWLMQWEAQNAIDYWNQQIAEMEKGDETITIRAFAFTKPREGFEFKFVSTHYLILILVTIFIAGWVGLLIYFLKSILLK